MSEVRCPYCGGPMSYKSRDTKGHTTVAYCECRNCNSQSPMIRGLFHKNDPEALKAQTIEAAMKRQGDK